MTTETDYESAAMARFMSDGVMLADGIDPQNERKSNRREKNIKAASKSFYRVMNSEHPPKSREEAARRALGFLGMFFASIFPQYALAIKVAFFLWDIFHQGK
jgi:hypothetical protein